MRSEKLRLWLLTATLVLGCVAVNERYAPTPTDPDPCSWTGPDDDRKWVCP